ncbi:SSI family serine proteinase inhibitor [Actinokineospora inagensis]|uniref:SSI family serine proteinase inhibitor n=1 Tax=Actinokineospora inagensis TaxID=103730 RepID=UPI00040B375D|nr:SSI family serine proteinase inhibitor [Actinokineospora inagensis]
MSAKSLALAAACVALAAVVPATTAEAAESGIAPVRAGFVLTVDHAGDLPRLAVLQCSPNGGTHPSATLACAQLSQVDGRFDKLNVNQGVACVMIYDPVQVSAAGLWGRRVVHYAHTFGNACELRAATGVVFGI